MARELKTFQIFRAGTHVAMNGTTVTFDLDDISDTARMYKQTIWSAPLVLGHPVSDNAPSHGDVVRMFVEGLALYAEAEVDSELIDLVRGGRYTNRSASFYHPSQANNPVPGIYYLRHVGFLGGQPPAVKGMAPLGFGEANPLLDDISRRFFCYAEPESFRSTNPLIADAEARQMRDRATSGYSPL